MSNIVTIPLTFELEGGDCIAYRRADRSIQKALELRR